MYRAQHGFAQEYHPKQTHFAPPEIFNRKILPKNMPTNLKESLATVEAGTSTRASNEDIQIDDDWLADYMEELLGLEGEEDIINQINFDL